MAPDDSMSRLVATWTGAGNLSIGTPTPVIGVVPTTVTVTAIWRRRGRHLWRRLLRAGGPRSQHHHQRRDGEPDACSRPPGPLRRGLMGG